MNWCFNIFVLVILIMIILYLINKYNFRSFSKESFSINNNNSINIIQHHPTKNLPKKYQKLSNKVKELNPNFNYLLFDDKEIINIIHNNFYEYLPTTNNLIHTESKYNFYKLLLVYHLGGIYLSFDIELYQSFSDLNFDKVIFPLQFTNIENLVLQPQGYQILLGNYFFYAPKKHPFIKKIIDNIVANPHNIYTNFNLERYIFYTTGPVIITQTYIDYKNKNEIELLSITPFKNSYIGKYGRFLKFLNLFTWSQNLYNSYHVDPLSYPAYQPE